MQTIENLTCFYEAIPEPARDKFASLFFNINRPDYNFLGKDGSKLIARKTFGKMVSLELVFDTENEMVEVRTPESRKKWKFDEIKIVVIYDGTDGHFFEIETTTGRYIVVWGYDEGGIAHFI